MKNKVSINDRIGLYEKFLDNFTNNDLKIKPCSPESVFDFFITNFEIILNKNNKYNQK